MSKWMFSGIDSDFKRFSYSIIAPDKQAAIKKGFETLKKRRGDYSGNTHNWECHLIKS